MLVSDKEERDSTCVCFVCFEQMFANGRVHQECESNINAERKIVGLRLWLPLQGIWNESSIDGGSCFWLCCMVVKRGHRIKYCNKLSAVSMRYFSANYLTDLSTNYRFWKDKIISTRKQEHFQRKFVNSTISCRT